MIFSHWSEVRWDAQRWPNFQPWEFACKHCGEFYWAPRVFDAVQAIRIDVGCGVHLNSAHRCPIHNAAEGGKPLSAHKKIALDIGLAGHDPMALYRAARRAGFTTFGFYMTFLHTDPRPGRRWFSSKQARDKWTSLGI